MPGPTQLKKGHCNAPLVPFVSFYHIHVLDKKKKKGLAMQAIQCIMTRHETQQDDCSDTYNKVVHLDEKKRGKKKKVAVPHIYICLDMRMLINNKHVESKSQDTGFVSSLPVMFLCLLATSFLHCWVYTCFFFG